MATKKDFTGINTGRATGGVASVIDKGTTKKGQQATASPEEAAERAATLNTQGRKGCKATRINMAFTPDNHDFIKTMAKIRGETMTEYTNRIIEQYREEHGEEYAKILEIRNML